ncbi:hypothetical protein [Deinococcus yunweiensis]|uniref:hypothetical protein n=1 Tax=Deinococcus yunweiensis TaxID=367282 RepID=UPI00398F36AC
MTDWKVMMSRSDIAFELYRGRSRTHPGRAAALLVGYHQEAYPRSSRTPQSAPLGAFDGIQAAEADLEVASLIERLVGRSGGQQEWQDHVNKALRSEPDPTFASLLKRYMRRVVNDLIIRLGRTLSMQELISRFRIRAMWYDKSRLRELANTVPEGNVNLRSEDNLTKELAMYLFDQGHPVLIKADIENVQLDLLGLGTPILVESKITRRGTRAVRNELIRGVAQLHAYMVNLEHSAQHVEEAFYVVFRLEGPIFELPSVFRTSRFVIYPVVIDVGTSETSGRNQALPSPIALEELRAELEKPAPPT